MSHLRERCRTKDGSVMKMKQQMAWEFDYAEKVFLCDEAGSRLNNDEIQAKIESMKTITTAYIHDKVFRSCKINTHCFTNGLALIT